MRILMTGATGFIGHHIAQTLSKQHHQVRVLARSPQKAKIQMPFISEAYFWDGTRAPEAGFFLGIDAVIHLAGEPIAKGRWTAKRKKELWDSRVTATNNLLIGLKDSEQKIKCFMGASAVGIFGDRGDELLTEESSIGTGFLADLCHAWESASKGAAPSARVVHLRTGIVLGDGGFLKEVAPLFKLGLGGKIGSGKQWMSWIHISDLVQLIMTVLRDDNYSGAINAVAPQPARNSELTRQLAKAVHRPSLFPAPAFAVKAAFGQMSEVLLSSQRVSAEKLLALGFKFQFSDLASAMTDATQFLGKTTR